MANFADCVCFALLVFIYIFTVGIRINKYMYHYNFYNFQLSPKSRSTYVSNNIKLSNISYSKHRFSFINDILNRKDSKGRPLSDVVEVRIPSGDINDNGGYMAFSKNIQQFENEQCMYSFLSEHKINFASFLSQYNGTDITNDQILERLYTVLNSSYRKEKKRKSRRFRQQLNRFKHSLYQKISQSVKCQINTREDSQIDYSLNSDDSDTNSLISECLNDMAGKNNNDDQCYDELASLLSEENSMEMLENKLQKLEASSSSDEERRYCGVSDNKKARRTGVGSGTKEITIKQKSSIRNPSKQQLKAGKKTVTFSSSKLQTQEQQQHNDNNRGGGSRGGGSSGDEIELHLDDETLAAVSSIIDENSEYLTGHGSVQDTTEFQDHSSSSDPVLTSATYSDISDTPEEYQNALNDVENGVQLTEDDWRDYREITRELEELNNMVY